MSRFALISSDPNALYLVAASLSQAVTVHGQLFCRSDSVVMQQLAEAGTLIKVGESPEAFLDRVVTDPGGFCLADRQARDVSMSGAWTYCRRNMKVVLVQWKDPVASYMISRGSCHIDCEDLARHTQIAKATDRDLSIYFPQHHTTRVDDFDPASLASYLELDQSEVSDISIPEWESRVLNLEEVRARS